MSSSRTRWDPANRGAACFLLHSNRLEGNAVNSLRGDSEPQNSGKPLAHEKRWSTSLNYARCQPFFGCIALLTCVAPLSPHCPLTHTVEQHILWSNTFSGLTVCTATPQDITKLFASPKCPTYVTCEFADNDCWYVTFDSEESTQKVSWFQPSTRQGAGIVRSQLILKYTHHCIVSQCVLCVLP